MIQPVEMKETRPIKIHDGGISTTTDVWNMLSASQHGDLARVTELVQRCPGLMTCEYDYTAPLHLAVREGHLDIVRYLVGLGALDPTYETHPFRDSLVTVSEDRGLDEIAQFLKQSLIDAKLTRAWGDTGGPDYGQDETQRRFQDLVDKNKHAEVEALLTERPELALNELAFWAEGILSMPAKDGDRHMLELLMRYGARVPDISKWGARYYFRHYEIAVFLMENGMNPNHMNWRQFTLLHDMAFVGDVAKARLLIDHGADINAIDEEYCSTPLGFAARWGRLDVVNLLLEHSADPNKSGAPWATPLAWARKKGHADVDAALRQAGAE